VQLTGEERARFEHDGFLVLDRPIVEPDDVAEARDLLQDLFDRFDRLPPDHAYDLGDVKHHDGEQQIPEINRTIELDPRLARTAAFTQCRDLARDLLGVPARYGYDHAICKPPRSDASVEWHQDLAYGPQNDSVAEVHIWLALQDVDEANGCLRFIPDDEQRGLLPHRPRGGSSRAHALVAEGVDVTRAVPCPLGAGMVVVHRLTTLHSSGPNSTAAPRLAWILHFRDEGPVPATTRLRSALFAAKHSLHR
jgi:hypothetical protein